MESVIGQPSSLPRPALPGWAWSRSLSSSVSRIHGFQKIAERYRALEPGWILPRAIASSLFPHIVVFLAEFADRYRAGVKIRWELFRIPFLKTVLFLVEFAKKLPRWNYKVGRWLS